MSHVLNEEDMNLMLDSVLPEGEIYISKIWATVKVQNTFLKKFELLGGIFSPAPKTCYVGLTENKVIIAVTKLIRISKIKKVHVLDISRIKNARLINPLILKDSKTFLIENDDNKTYEIFTYSSTSRTNTFEQGHAIEIFINRLCN